MKFAYADPPYLGCGRLYDANHANSRVWDDPETHRALFVRLFDEYPDGWALSCSSPSLEVLLPMVAGRGCRVSPWTKPFAIFKPNVNPAYAWEPIIWHGGRKGDRKRATVRDWVSANITLKKGLTGAKPPAVCNFIFDLLGVLPGDELDDLFPGTGIVTTTLAEYMSSKVAAQ